MLRAAPLLAILLLAGCLDGPAAPAEPTPTGEEVPFRTLLLSSHAQVLEQQDFAGELSPAMWNATWARYAATQDPRPAQPAVDLSRERIFAVGIGPFGDGCHDVRISDARIEGGMRTIWYDVYNGSGPERVCTAVMTYPTHVIALETQTYWTFASREYGPDEWPHAPAQGPRAEALEMRTLDQGSFSTIGEDVRAVLRTEEAWHALWARHDAGAAPPAVDFATEMVVAVVVHGPTGCGQPRIVEVTHDAGAKVVTTTILHETPEVQCLVAFEDVYHFVAVPAREGEARFLDLDRHESEPTQPTTRAPEPVPLEPTPSTPTPSPRAPGGNYSFRTLAQGTASGIEEVTRAVIRNETDWRSFWAEHAAPMIPAPEAPAVDWTSERVFVATAGTKSNTCWSIRVDRIDERDNSVNVQVTTLAPPPDVICGQAVSHPYHYVTYPMTDKPLLLFEAQG